MMASPKLSILAVIVALFLSHTLYAASAASGGRMGGSSFSSETSSSSSSFSSFSSQHDNYHNNYYDSFGFHGYRSHPFFSRNSNEENGSMAYDQENGNGSSLSYLVIMLFVGTAFYMVYLYIVDGGISVLQVQVGLSAKAHSLQRELTKIASATDSSTADGWNFILKETISSLLHHPSLYLYGYSSGKHCWTNEDAEDSFKQLSKEEQLKFDIESLANINNIKRQRAIVPKANKVNQDCIVVTILVAAQGAHNLPTVSTYDDVKKALRSLTEIQSSEIKAVEVLWSPQNETDSLSIEELLENYPQLRRI